MALPAAENTKVRKALQVNWGGALTGLTKPDIAQAVDATDDWIDDTTAKPGGTSNQSSYLSFLAANAAAFDANSTGAQKSTLFALVTLQRAGLIDKIPQRR